MVVPQGRAYAAGRDLPGHKPWSGVQHPAHPATAAHGTVAFSTAIRDSVMVNKNNGYIGQCPPAGIFPGRALTRSGDDGGGTVECTS